MDYRNLLYDTAERLINIKINRPKSLNALNYETLEQLKDAITRAMKDFEVAVKEYKGKERRYCVKLGFRRRLHLRLPQSKMLEDHSN